MGNLRTYGASPYTVAVLHGGPGAPGSVAPIARALADEWGVLEPLQTRDSVEGQIAELRDVLEGAARLPVALVGHSWGAMLGFLFAARYPTFVSKLILVGSGVFTDEAAQGIDQTRTERMSAEQRAREDRLGAALNDPAITDKDAIMAELGALAEAVDAYDLLEPAGHEDDALPVSYDIYSRVWPEVAAMRARGELLAAGRHIACPLVAIHGDYDPHPVHGIREPLAPILRDFRFILLERCGHSPWLERHARDAFYRLLREELRDQSTERI